MIDPGTALLGSAGINFASGALGTGFGVAATHATNEANKEIARMANETSVSLANTQYQRAKADMEKAGLNPALMFGSAGPAPTPAMQVARMEKPDFSGVAMTGQAVSNALMQGLQFKQAQQVIDNNYLKQLEDIAKIKAEIKNLPSESGLLKLEKELKQAQNRLADFNSKPNDLGQLGTKLLSRFIEMLEAKYNKGNTAENRSSFIKWIMDTANKVGPFPMTSPELP